MILVLAPPQLPAFRQLICFPNLSQLQNPSWLNRGMPAALSTESHTMRQGKHRASLCGSGTVCETLQGKEFVLESSSSMLCAHPVSSSRQHSPG